ncbi:epoxide hydrolase family protein [Stackebrandtia nassauensis]|uniref:Epoxide hydrolase domain protein n=1 Tax=Stackebrandtia nassauensis (strain DSM 44728 / CIP 108903 / NRRL B-16338 / NBRC 102104 / LLR-40K-21) TaxID=446470 RepID=D3Q9C0_STANL|nr:epoxide hydrolase family protein [Stackebrandtia nassauensis]ADD42602.1 Epoxide hydrolase domain protein [Stackebrandtia nassauensis DSM 44728]
MNDIHPYRIDIPESRLADLRDRLDRTRWPHQPAGVGWEYGADVSYMRELVEYWRTTYDWRGHEKLLNSYPQFTTTIDGADVHFIHVRSPEAGALPLIMTHGWPGSIVEFLDVIGPLTDPVAHGGRASDAFHLVLPTIPGYGLSGPTPDTGWTVERIAGAWAELMRRLGYDRYGAQGGDWGYPISHQLGILFSERVVGVHLNALATPRPDDAEYEALTAQERERLDAVDRITFDRTGYSHLQATRPQTLAYALTDSPAGQLAWIAEKFKEWTDSDTVPEDAVSRDRLLTNVMLYWLTGTAGSSSHIYLETMRSGTDPYLQPTATPTGVAVFGGDLVKPVRSLAEKAHNIVHWSEFPRGGHFAAMEQPELMVADVRDFFGELAAR